ncbi:MAG: HEPN domain-containing protein [Ignavibacteria bacterium]|nr:HEPN domain-containing protein [Ignavibacteria bacterium]
MQNKSNAIKYWCESAKHDLDSAFAIFSSERYDWSLFVGHLALEKLLKALWIKNNDDIIPPRIPNLVKLAEDANFKLSDAEKLFLFEVNDFNIETRYPDKKFDFYKKCNKGFAEDYLTRIKEFFDCILKKI